MPRPEVEIKGGAPSEPPQEKPPGKKVKRAKGKKKAVRHPVTRFLRMTMFATPSR
jgi:hypothetical protein